MKTQRQQRRRTKLLTVTILSLSWLFSCTALQARITSLFKVPADLNAPGRRVAGGSRSMESCFSENKHLTALVPQSHIMLTTAGNPVFYFFIPKTAAPTVELVLRDDQNQTFVKQSYKPSAQAGVVGIPLSKKPLEVGKVYHWVFSVICHPQARSNDKVVEGAIKRIQPEPQLVKKLENATPQQRLSLYGQAGIWQNALMTLAELRYSHPDSPELKAQWQALLNSDGVGLGKDDVTADSAAIVSEPLLQTKLDEVQQSK
ncbi:MAG: DUF928 domain-containing protein [Rhizonema sp. PD38]|nr:DUF928 domain-containing protein [Rhizonema sp. PD38]